MDIASEVVLIEGFSSENLGFTEMRKNLTNYISKAINKEETAFC